MIEYFLRLLESRDQSKINAVAAQIGEASVEEVCRKLGNRCDQMTFSETRGYVRVRAAQVVWRHTRRQIACSQNLPDKWAGAIVRQATERILPQVLRQLSRTAMPATPLPLQRAA